MLGSSATVANAMPPEAGAPIAELAEQGASKMPNAVNVNLEGVVGNGLSNAEIPVMAANQAVNNPIKPTATGVSNILYQFLKLIDNEEYWFLIPTQVDLQNPQ